MATVVVGVDGSKNADAALDWALDEARRRGAILRVVHAWDVPNPAAIIGYMPIPEESLYETARDGAQRVLEESVAGLDAAEVSVEPLLVEGPTVGVLVAAACGADLLVVGSGGRAALTDVLVGATGTRLAREAPCPLTIVPHAAS